MELVYASKKVEEQCTDLKAAKKLFAGSSKLAVSLIARVNALEQAVVLKDIVVQRQFHFHKLLNKNGKNLDGLFAIDVKARQDPWRIILRPLDENDEQFKPCNIDEIAGIVEIVGIEEVSRHYEYLYRVQGFSGIPPRLLHRRDRRRKRSYPGGLREEARHHPQKPEPAYARQAEPVC